jgi:hypothetical protein
VASPLLSLVVVVLVAASGCFNPFFLTEVETLVNHAPTVDGMTPEPSFGMIPVNVGDNCTPKSFGPVARVDDADADPLTVLWSIVIKIESDSEVGSRVDLKQDVMAPLEEPTPEGFLYEPFEPFEPSRVLLESKLLGSTNLQRQVNERAQDGQLLELRISDGGFLGDDVAVPEGRDLFFASWHIQLQNTACHNP